MKFSFFVLKLCCLWSAINAQLHPQSPCPGIFSYEGSEPEPDHWYGVILVSTDEALVGVRLDIRFDRPAQLLVSWMGDVTSSNNERFTILSLTQKLLPGPPLSSRFRVKYDPARGSPQLRSIRLNGRQICPPDPNFPVSLSRPPYDKPTRRPDPAFEQNYNMGGHAPSEPAIFDHQTSTTTRVYSFTESLNQYTTPARNPMKPSNGYNEPEDIQTTRRPPYGNEGRNPDNFNNGGYQNNSRPNYYETPNYHKPQVMTSTTESYYNNQGRPNNNNNYYDNYNNMPNSQTTTTTTKKPNTYNSNSKNPGSNSNNNEDNYSTSHTNSNSGNDNYSNNNNGKNKNQYKPSNSQSLTNSSYNSNSGSNSNQRTTSSYQRTTTTEKYKKTTQRSQTSQNSDYTGSRVNPTKNSNSNSNSANSFQYHGGRPSSTSKYQNSDTIESSSSKSYECGVVDNTITSSSDSASPVPLITNGQKTARGQWPWHIALYKIEGINLSYVCGGTLVSFKVVITAAHCVTKKLLDRPVDPDVLVVYLGKYHLYQFSDDGGVQNKQVKDVYIYPSYNSSNFLGDIAVLILSSPVEYTSYVRPCCLWKFSSSVIGKEGTVVGWGYDENDRVTEELKMAKMPVVSHETCVYSYPDFFTRFTSNQTFCAGFRKGTTVCNGDSGGGMVFYQDTKWYLRGLVSITVAREGHRVCDTNHYVIFTDVAEFLGWIEQYLT